MRGDTPQVSIVTPAFNAGRLIGETIRSVQAQTTPDWEMLVVDDASTDGTALIAGSIAATDPRIRLIRQQRNTGPAQARQAALDAARGRYIAFLDSDDLWLPEKLERQTRFMRERSAVLTYTAYRRISEDGSKTGRLIQVPPSMTYHQLLKNTVIPCLTVMIDRDKSGPLYMIDEPYDDYILWLTVLRRGFVSEGLREDLARYRMHKNSVSSRKLRSAKWVWNIQRNVQGLSLPDAIWCFAHYAWRAWWKRRSF